MGIHNLWREKVTSVVLSCFVFSAQAPLSCDCSSPKKRICTEAPASAQIEQRLANTGKQILRFNRRPVVRTTATSCANGNWCVYYIFVYIKTFIIFGTQSKQNIQLFMSSRDFCPKCGNCGDVIIVSQAI